MKKIWIVCVIFFFACEAAYAQSADPMAIENRMEKLQKEMEKVRADFQNLQRKPVKIAPEETGIVLEGYERQLSEIERKIQNLTGQIEVLEHKIETESKNNKKIKEDNDLRFQMIEKKVGDIEEKEQKIAEDKAKAKAEKEKKAAEAKAKADKEKKAAEAKKEASKPAPVKPEVKPAEPKKLTERERYNAAFALVRENKYDEAIGAMKDLIRDYPDGKYVSNAYYWMAECYSVQKKYDLAALAFGEGFQKVRKGSKAPDSLYRLGMTFAKLGKMEEACTALHSFNEEFPEAGAELKKKVEDGLKEYKCE